MAPPQPLQNVGGTFDSSSATMRGCPVADGLDPTRIMCCNKVVTRTTHMGQMEAESAVLEALTEFKEHASGLMPDRVLDPSQRIPWESFEFIVGIIGSSSRGSKQVRGGGFYAMSKSGGSGVSELVQIPIRCLPVIIHSVHSLDTQVECLVRSVGGLELRCQRHLDTNFTLYLARYNPPRPINEGLVQAPPNNSNCSRVNALGVLPYSNDPQLNEFRHRNSRTMLDIEKARLQAESVRISAPNVPPNKPTREANSARRKETYLAVPRTARGKSPVVPRSPKTPANKTPQTLAADTPKAPAKKVPKPPATKPPNTRANKINNPASQNVVPSGPAQQEGPPGMMKCSKMRRFLPQDQFDINPNTGNYYKHCRACLGRSAPWNFDKMKTPPRKGRKASREE
ncbi:uncharacterized protein BP5553_03030 [Venustampulla echinocandica]|uniref:Uncharacterized protein n=1 Tax=Venustampulla echinocandica TaxID=2656787 RepID=A0A370TT24_9HELO|nr:uncharacterized protein BP5553_03030 [Venustampulla echinocandica]RDL38690.1 hypothetical protein BP5553_03030 [Venustampulla echinocandica]